MFYEYFSYDLHYRVQNNKHPLYYCFTLFDTEDDAFFAAQHAAEFYRKTAFFGASLDDFGIQIKKLYTRAPIV